MDKTIKLNILTIQIPELKNVHPIQSKPIQPKVNKHSKLMMTSRKYWCDIWIISIFLCFSGRRRYLPVWQMQETIHFALVVYDPQTRTVHSADASPSVLRNCLSHGTHTHQCSGAHVFTQPDWSGIYSNHIYLMHLATFPHSIIMYSRFMIQLHPIGQYSNQMGWVSDISCCMTITSTYQVVNIWDYIKSCSFPIAANFSHPKLCPPISEYIQYLYLVSLGGGEN